ncbi:hypothetical protein DPMN_052048 [Dreissena polymorpha]|uniref:Uncharacterized protein n=1 Tax=Dreissena polymorpha TaxID=45954 RepID=A0A9D4HPG8_DREPO|nr:hypothetical protein DPMN_052048 [Dreissena polymorpha]
MSMFLSIVVLLLTSLAAAMDVQVCGSALDDMLGLVCGHRGFNWLKTQGISSMAFTYDSEGIWDKTLKNEEE